MRAMRQASTTGWFVTVGPDLLVEWSTRPKLGEQTAFYGQSLGSTVDAVRRYPGELLRLIAEMGMGTGALAVIGGTVGIIGFLTLTTGALIAVQGYDTLVQRRSRGADRVSVGVLQRPHDRAVHGWGGTGRHDRCRRDRTAWARCASTRRSTRSKSWRSVRSPISRRPGSLPASWSSSRSTPLRADVVLRDSSSARCIIYGQSRGVYDHYFSSFLHPTDLFWSFIGGAVDGDRVMVDAHLLWLQRDGWSGGCGRSGRSLRAVIDHCHGLHSA